MTINLHNTDCMTFMKDKPDNSIDCIVTSPPYNKNGYRGRRDNSKVKGRWSGADIKYNSYDDNMEESEYKKWQIEILNECYRTLKDTGSMFYNHKVRRANSEASHPYEWVSKSNFKFYQQIVWDRCGSCDHNINYLDPTTELIFWLVKNKPICNKNNKFATEIWRFPPDIGNKHPAPFPVILAELCIEMATKKDMLVCDLFLGSGTVAVASHNLGRKFIGCELDKDYFDAAQKRFNNHKKQGLLF